MESRSKSGVVRLVFLELLSGFEPETSSLPRKCSTTELQQQCPAPAFFPEEAQPRRVLVSRSEGEPPARSRQRKATRRGGRAAGAAVAGEPGAGDGNRTHALSLEG